MWAGSQASWRMTGNGHARVRNGAVSLTGHALLGQGCPNGLGPDQEGNHDGQFLSFHEG